MRMRNFVMDGDDFNDNIDDEHEDNVEEEKDIENM